MLLRLGMLMLCSGISVGAEPRKEPKTYTPEAIENSAAYPSALVTELTPVVEPAAAQRDVRAITRERRKKLEARMRATFAKFGVKLAAPLECEDGSRYLLHRSKAGVVQMVFFDDMDEISQVYLTGSDLPDNGTKMVTPELFEGYALECYRKAFGVPPVGKIEFERDGSGIRDRHDETARWTVSIDGVPMKKSASVTASMDDRGQWSLSCTKGPSTGEVEALTKVLQTRPTRISEEEAVAAAWKNWKKVGTAPSTGSDFTIWCQLREVTRKETEPWGEHSSFKTERLAWKNKTPGSSPTDSVFHEVRITKSLFEINVLVDRQTGQVLRMNQGRMSW